MENSLSWQVPEYHFQHKTTDWYWAVGIIGLSAAATAVIFGNVLFAILLIVAIFSLMLFASRPPKIVDVTINEKGVTLGKVRYPYASLDSFWINEEGVHPKLLITSKKRLAPHIAILIDNVAPDDVRRLLDRYLREEEQHESLIHLIMEYLGF